MPTIGWDHCLHWCVEYHVDHGLEGNGRYSVFTIRGGDILLSSPDLTSLEAWCMDFKCIDYVAPET